MEIFEHFDDDIFEQPRKREIKESVTYSAKQCEEEWFFKEDLKTDGNDRLQILLPQGDLLYHQKRWKEALNIYRQCLIIIKPSNDLVKRMLQESLARCYLHMRDFCCSKELALKMLQNSQTVDHYQVAHNFLAEICRKAGDLEDEMYHLQQYLKRQPLIASHWYRLAEVYLRYERTRDVTLICSKCCPSEHTPSPESNCKSQSELDCDEVTSADSLLTPQSKVTNKDQNEKSIIQSWVKADDQVEDTERVLHDSVTNHMPHLSGRLEEAMCSCTIGEFPSLEYAAVCLVRSRLAVKPLLHQDSTFSKNRNQQLAEEIESQLGSLEMSESKTKEIDFLCWQNLSYPNDRVTDPNDGAHETSAVVAKRQLIRDFEENWIVSILKQVQKRISE